MGFRRGSRTSRKKQEVEQKQPTAEELKLIKEADDNHRKMIDLPPLEIEKEVEEYFRISSATADHYYQLKARDEAKRRAQAGRDRRMAQLKESRRKQRRIQDQERHAKNAAERHPVVKSIDNPRVSMLVEQPRIAKIDSKGRMEIEAERSKEPIPLDPLTKIQLITIGRSIFVSRRSEKAEEK